MRGSRAMAGELAAWWCWAGLAAAMLALASARIESPIVPVVLALATGTVIVTWYAWARGPVNSADRVTFARAGLTCAVAGCFGALFLDGALTAPTPPGSLPVSTLPGPLVAAVAGVSLALDALDGYVARRRGSTARGARFDMESDALLIALLALAVAPTVGWWVLSIGAARYVFARAGLALPWLTAPLPPSTARKTVAAVQGVALAVTASGLLPVPAAQVVCAAASAALAWSFGRDTRWLWRHRGAAPAWQRVPAWLGATAKVGTGVAILGFLAARFGTDGFVEGAGALTPATVACALGIGLLTTIGSALRWRLVATRLGALHLRLTQAVGAYYRSLFLNASLPAGIVGDAERAVRHAVSSGAPGPAARAVVFERLSGQVALWVVTAVALATGPAWLGVWASPVESAVGVGLLLGLLAALLVGVVATRRASRHGDGRVRGELRRLLAADTWPQVTGLSLAVLAGHVALFLVAARAVGAQEPVTTLLPLVLLALVAMGVPLNVGGWGPREGAAAWAFATAGLGAQLGLSTAVAYGVLAFVASLPGLPVWLLGRRAQPAAASDGSTTPSAALRPTRGAARAARTPGVPATRTDRARGERGRFGRGRRDGERRAA